MITFVACTFLSESGIVNSLQCLLDYYTCNSAMNIVDLEQDVFGKHQCTKTFVGLVNFLSSQGIIQPTAEELPSSLQSFKDALSDKNSSSNIKLFILKVITECRDIFQQYAKHFLGDILRVIMMPETWPRGNPMINYFSLDILVSTFSQSVISSACVHIYHVK